MQHSGFFNAVNVDGVYDRTYNSNDYCSNLAVVISNGVLRSSADSLKVTASGMIATVAAGRAWIDGHYYYNDAPYAFSSITAPSGGSRWDRVVLRMSTEIEARSVSLVYLRGTAANNPEKPAPSNTDSVKDLVLADIYIEANATSVTVTDTRADADLCGWVYSTSGDNSFFENMDEEFNEWFTETRDSLSSVTLFKRYNWVTTLLSASNTVQFSISQWDVDTCFLEVYVNGVLDNQGTDYTISGTNNDVLTFANNLIAGTEITVKVYKSIDGTGINSVADEITELQNQVAALNGVANFTYYCTGLNDNLSISQIAQALYSGSYVAANVTPAAAAFLSRIGGNTYLAAIPADGQVTINVSGRLAASTPFAGSGTSASRYKWFSLGVEQTGEKRVIFDFANCERIYITPAGSTDNIIFYGTDMYIRNVNVFARCNAASCAVEMFSGRYNNGKIIVENSALKITTTGRAVIAENGDFINCNVYCSAADTHSLCFVPDTDSFIRLIGGTFRSYTASQASDNISAIFYTYATATNGVVMAYNINCPTVAVEYFYQKRLAVTYAGKTYINGVCTTLESLSNGTYLSINGQVPYNKAR